jgi:uracil-DNA glycosylase family 4
MLPKPHTCLGCPLYGGGQGFVPADGSGSNAVLIVLEAAGEHEEKEGKPLAGRSGFSFMRMLQRAGLKREDFRIHNVLSCRPPDNKLRGMGYEAAAIAHCAPNLDATIARMQPRVIVAAGDVAFQRILPDLYTQLKAHRPSMGLMDARGYVHWSERYRAWVIPTIHPAFILRGQTAFESVFIRDLLRAVEVAQEGFKAIDLSHMQLDPTPSEALEWARRFEIASAIDPSLHLAIDDETPWKGEDEEELDNEEEENGARPVQITRMGYAYGAGKYVLSIPWGGMYEAVHRRLLRTPAPKVAWNKGHDEGDIRALGFELNGAIHDGMIAWHVLHSDLRKKLGFVTPFLIPDMPMWKHLSHERPAYYNGCDAFTEDVNYCRIRALLVRHGLAGVYDRHIAELDIELAKMSARGMPIDPKRRWDAAVKLDGLLREVRARMQLAVPDDLKPIVPKKGYVREPKDLTGLVQVVIDGVLRKRCDRCGIENPTKPHFTKKTIAVEGTAGRKKADRRENTCFGSTSSTKLEGTTRWARRLPFTPSPTQILAYMKARRHRPIMHKGKPTTNAKAMNKIMGKYGEDPLYPLILEHRDYQKLAGTYIGYPEGSDVRPVLDDGGNGIAIAAVDVDEAA